MAMCDENCSDLHERQGEERRDSEQHRKEWRRRGLGSYKATAKSSSAWWRLFKDTLRRPARYRNTLVRNCTVKPNGRILCRVQQSRTMF